MDLPDFFAASQQSNNCAAAEVEGGNKPFWKFGEIVRVVAQ